MSQSPETLIRKWLTEVWNDRREATIDELLGHNSIGHMEGVEVRSPDEFKVVWKQFLTAFPDMRIKVEDVVADESNAVARWSVIGTHKGDNLGCPACNKQIDFRGITWFRFAGGQIVEGWDSWNIGGLLQRLQSGG